MKKTILGATLICLLTPTLAFASTSAADLPELTGTTATDVTYNDAAGYSVASGDINSDGYGDIIVGAPTDSLALPGRVYLVYGSEQPFTDHTLSDAVTFTPPSPVAQLGQAVASGDLNGDGYDDVIMSSSTSIDTNAMFDMQPGNVYVVYGQASQLTSLALSTSNSTVITGEAIGDEFGFSVAAADLNGDAVDDLIVGANSNGASGQGAAYLYYGTLGSELADVTGSSIELDGNNANDYLGTSIARIGDSNNDGFEDVAITATGVDTASSNIGRVYLLYGKAAHYSSSAINSSGASRFNGEAADDNTGVVAPGGDINDDGYDDFLVGVEYADSGSSSSIGKVYIIYGQAATYPNSALTGKKNYTGLESNDFTGHGLALGDTDNNGYADIIAGTNDEAEAGEMYVAPGGNNLVSTTFSTYPTYVGTAVTDYFGSAIVTGDFNNDGYSDIAVGAYDNNTRKGSVYIVYSYVDTDGDGVAGTAGVNDGTDCNDSDSTVSANQTYYADGDEDGLGSTLNSTSVCSSTAPAGYVSNHNDNNDSDVDNDGTSTSSDCNDADPTISAQQTYYQDADSDGLGSAAVTTTTCSLTPPTGYVINSNDTDDTVASGNSDNDGDGAGITTDCNDADATVSEYQTYYRDADGDGYGDPSVSTSACSATAPTGYVTNNYDADDTNNTLLVDYGTLDPDDAVTATNVLVSVHGKKNGKIIVTYSDTSSSTYTIFNHTSTKKTKVKQYTDLGYYLVVQSNGKKIALVNAYTGEVYNHKKVSHTKYSKVGLLIADLRQDGKTEAIVTNITDTAVQVSVFKVNRTTRKLKKRDSIVVQHDNVAVTKTKVKGKKIQLRNSHGHTQVSLHTNSQYQLSESSLAT